MAHDCQVGNDTVFANGTALGGHVEVGDRVILGGGAMVHQFSRIGRNTMVGGQSASASGRPALQQDLRLPGADPGDQRNRPQGGWILPARYRSRSAVPSTRLFRKGNSREENLAEWQAWTPRSQT